MDQKWHNGLLFRLPVGVTPVQGVQKVEEKNVSPAFLFSSSPKKAYYMEEIKSLGVQLNTAHQSNELSSPVVRRLNQFATA